MTSRTRPAQLLWAGLFSCTFVLAATAYVVQQPPKPPHAFMLPALVVAALAAVVASFVLPPQMSRKALTAALTPLIVERPNPAAEVMSREAAPPLKVFGDPAAAWTKALFAFQKPLMVSLVYPMAAAVLGIAVVSKGFPRETAIPFLVVCWVLQIARFPTDAKLAAAVKVATDVELPLGS